MRMTRKSVIRKNAVRISYILGMKTYLIESWSQIIKSGAVCRVSKCSVEFTNCIQKFGLQILFIYFVLFLQDIHEYNIHPRVGICLLGIFLSWVLNSCVWVNNSSCWTEGGVPGVIRTWGCRTAAQRTNHWATLHPTELFCILFFWALMHPYKF